MAVRGFARRHCRVRRFCWGRLGKTYGILLEAARHVDNPGFRGTIFRRTSPQITAGGGLWDGAAAVYPRVGAVPNVSSREWRFSGGGRLAFRHLQHESDIYNWQGAELAFIGWDELTHFTERQFFYLLSRNRTTCGIRPYVRATCNPDSGSWVKGFLQWWLDPQTGLPIPERAGVLRWFYRVGDEINWYDERAEAETAHPDMSAYAPPLSVTFIPAKLDDNAILCSRDPGYRAKLIALSWVERARLLGGNWNASASDGLFQAEWFSMPVQPEDLPKRWRRKVRSWDLAATEQGDNNDPDYFAGVLMGEEDTGYDVDGKHLPPRFWILDAERHRISPLKVKKQILTTAALDGADVEIVIEQEAAASGKILASEFEELLTGMTDLDGKPKPAYQVHIFRPDKTTGDKVTRAFPFSAACERGEVKIAAGAWNRAFLGEITQFPAKGVHDDFVDAATMAHMRLTQPGPQLFFGRSQPSTPKPVKRLGGTFLKRREQEDWDE